MGDEVGSEIYLFTSNRDCRFGCFDEAQQEFDRFPNSCVKDLKFTIRRLVGLEHKEEPWMFCSEQFRHLGLKYGVDNLRQSRGSLPDGNV